MMVLPLRSVWLPGLALALFAAITWPVWRWLWSEWNGNDYYSHGMLIPPVAIFLIYQRFKHDDKLTWLPGRESSLGLIVTGGAMAAYVLFLNNRAFYLAAFAAIALLVGLIWTFGGNVAVSRLRFPLAYLLLMTPLPFIDRATLPLAMFTGVCAGNAAQFLGLDVTIVGNAVTLPNADLVIGAQCSGINSLITLTALMALAAYLLEGPLFSRILLVLLAAPLAILGNILRVASLLFVARAYGAQAAFTYYHDYSGIAFFLLVLLFMLPLTRALGLHNLRSAVI
jgi:exosortase